MSWRRRTKGSPESVASESALWKDSVLGEDREQKAPKEMMDAHEAQCSAVQQALARYTLSRPADLVLDVEVEGHSTTDGVSELSLRIRESKKVELERSSTYSGRAD